MENANSLFFTVIVREDRLIPAMHFNFEEAKETLLALLNGNFNIETDDAFIFVCEKQGQGTPVFNYRSHLNNEDLTIPAEKETHVKVLFSCPKCKSGEGTIVQDKEEKVVIICKDCQNSEPVY